MNTKVFRKTLIIALTSIVFHVSLSAQIDKNTVISDTINTYTKVLKTYKPGSRSVKVADTTGFHKNDAVIIMQMKTTLNYVNITNPEGLNNGGGGFVGTAGKYEILRISEIPSKDSIVFTSTLSFDLFDSLIYDPKGYVQLIRVPIYKYVTVAPQGITCLPWDKTRGTGGVLAFFAVDSLILDGNIDVSGKGFQGADPGTDFFNGSCSDSINFKNINYSSSASDSSGLKGEGIAVDTIGWMRGRGYILSNPGGGNGRFSGGGGGGNVGSGGKGGSEYCTSRPLIGGAGADNSDLAKAVLNNFVFMGSGGGTGTQQLPVFKATKGGNGGGIIIAVTSQIISRHGKGFYANGDSVISLATGGAGGGGGGGAILLDMDTLKGTLNLQALGGRGGNTDTLSGETVAGGPGGGGGSGLVSYTKASPTIIVPDGADNQGINIFNHDFYGAGKGGFQGANQDAKIQTRGFLFNFLPEDDTVCIGEKPLKIIGTVARGGTTYDYRYTWTRTINGIDSVVLDGHGNSFKDYQENIIRVSVPLYYTRTVSTDNGILIDVSPVYTIHPFPPIKNNIIYSPDTILCSNGTPAPISVSSVTGGTGIFNYAWKISPDTLTFITGDTLSTGALYTPVQKLISNINDSAYYYYRRFVASGGCTSASTLLKVTILPPIRGNHLVSNQTLCQNVIPLTLSSDTLKGGRGNDFRKIWQIDTVGGIWSSPVSTSLNYSSPRLRTTTYVRRTVLSGPYDVCKDISNTDTLKVLTKLSGRFIYPTDTVICSGFAPFPLRGEKTSGGDTFSNVYRYRWYSSFNNIDWKQVYTSQSPITGFAPDTLISKRWYKRIVTSGLGDACRDSSDAILINVDPRISNNRINPGEIICQGNTPLLPFTSSDSIPSGGTGLYSYTWEQSPDSINWQIAVQIPFNHNGLSPVALQSDMYYRRTVKSGACYDTTQKPNQALLHIKVFPVIANNSKLVSDTIVCYGTSPKALNISGSPTGGNGSYQYSWYSGLDSISMTLIPSSTLETYAPGPITAPLFIKRKVISGPCQSLTKPVSLNIHTLPVGYLTGPVDSSICDNGRIQNVKISMIDGKAPWDVYLSNAGKYLQIHLADTTFEIKFNPVAGQSQLFNFSIDSLIDANSCMATSKSGLFTTTVYSLPVSSSVQFSDSACGNQKALSGKKPANAVGTWSILGSQNASIADTHDKNSIITNTNITSNVLMDSTFLKWEVYNWDTVCKVTKYGKVLFFNLIKPKILVPAYKLGFQKKDTTIFNYDSGILIAEEAQLPNKGKWSYSGSSSPIQFSAENNSTTEVHGLLANNTPGSWTVYWIVENAICPADTDIAYISSSVVHPYKGFSPGYGYIGTDGQSYDEVYLIEGIQYESNFKLTIISSWNKVVYSYQGAGDQWKGWDGKGNQFDNKGNDMPEGTYYYILEFRNQKLTGPILLRRKG